MAEFVWDYGCRTVGEGMERFRIPDDWCVEFEVREDICPVVVIQADQIRKVPAMMNLKLSVIADTEEEYAACTVLPRKKTIAFKIDDLEDLIKAVASTRCLDD